jgi:hypothetical protein
MNAACHFRTLLALALLVTLAAASPLDARAQTAVKSSTTTTVSGNTTPTWTTETSTVNGYTTPIWSTYFNFSFLRWFSLK